MGAGVAGFTTLLELGMVTPAGLLIIGGIGFGLAALNYADRHNYDTTEMYEDIKSKMDMLKDYLNGDTPPEDSDLTYDPSKFDPNTPAPDTDHDGIPDSIDPDRDGDGIPNAEDSDQDGDGIPDAIDPDPLTPNPNPKDGHPFAPLPPLQRRDPLVLDMNKDGLISTVSLADSTAFFDLTGDGIKEKVGWVQASEGIVAFDKNGNGKIDGISEVFGTATTSGFAELRALADSNYDGIIDRRDELYNQLKVWQDINQDGISQASELKTLSQAGVNTIELNVFATNINLNGNLLSEAGRYGDTTGTRSLAADVELTFDSRITTVDTSLIPDYTVHADAATLPKLRGYGVVYNSEIAYNVNDTLRNLAITMSTDITAVANNFESFMAEWSGLNDLLRTAQTKYHLSTAPTLSAIDEKVWIYERFLGQKNFSNAIESSINATAQGMTTGGNSVAATGLRYQVAAVEQSYNAIANRYRSYFTLQTLYPDVMKNAAYDISIDEFVVSDPSAFAADVSAYMNSTTVALEKKLFLADAMNSIQGTFLSFDGASVSSSITDPLLRELVSSIYADTLKAYVYGNGTYTSGNILAVGTEGDDTITISGSAGSTVLAGTGDDIVHGSSGNDVYLFRSGDGADTIIDSGGSDTLRLTDMLQSDIVLRSSGNDLIIGRAEAGKTFDELTDKVTLVNWANSANRIETLRFSDGSTFDFTDAISTYFVTEAGDSLDLSAGNDTLDALGGNDRVHGFGGNDTISGGTGDDTLYGDAGDDTLRGDAGADPIVIAKSYSNADQDTAYGLAELLNSIANTKVDDFNAKIQAVLDRDKLREFATQKTLIEHAFIFSKFCASVIRWDEELALEMAELFIPTAQQVLAKDPVDGFHQLSNDFVSQVLRVFDVLGIYVGKLKPDRRQWVIARRICEKIDPKQVAEHISIVRPRHFQSAGFFLHFLSQTAPRKYETVLRQLDWEKLDIVIGDDWANMPHDTEVLLSTLYTRPNTRYLVQKFISDRADRIVNFSPRIMLMVPEVALAHLAKGGLLRLAQYNHVDWVYGGAALAIIAKSKPELVERVITPFMDEIVRGVTLYYRNFTGPADLFIRIAIEFAPATWRTILSKIDPVIAEKNLAECLRMGEDHRRTAAAVIESAITLNSHLREIAQRLRLRFPKTSNVLTDKKSFNRRSKR